MKKCCNNCKLKEIISCNTLHDIGLAYPNEIAFDNDKDYCSKFEVKEGKIKRIETFYDGICIKEKINEIIDYINKEDE
jgi:hypothetical protein